MTVPETLRDAFDPSRIQYLNFPGICSREDYDSAVARYVGKLAGLQGVIGIGRFGSISAPGISDLDLIVITEDDLPPAASTVLSVAGLPAADRALFMHEAAIAPASKLRHIWEHLDISTVDTLWGAIDSTPAISVEDSRWQELATLMEWLGSFCKFFGETVSLGTSNVRWALPVLHSLRYSVRVAAQYVEKTPDHWMEYTNKVADLRSEWFGLPSDVARTGRLAELSAEGWLVTAELCCEIERYLAANGLLTAHGNHAGWRVYAYSPARFALVTRCTTAEAFVQDALALALQGDKHARGPWSRFARRIAPAWSLLPQFHDAFASAAGLAAPTVYSQIGRTWFGGDPVVKMDPTSPFEQYLVARMERLELQAQFLERNRLGFGAACSELIYAPPLEDGAPESWRRKLLLAAQKAWGTGRARALARTAA